MVELKGGASAAAAGLAMLALSACSAWSEPGVRVELHSQQSSSIGQALSGSAGTVRIERLRWTSTEIELLACSSVASRLGRWLLPEAHAHGLSTPTARAIPTIVDAASSVPMGEMAPPAGEYCSVRYRIAPADADAVGLPHAPEMLGTSLELRAVLEDDGSRELSLVTDQALDVTLDIDVALSSEERWKSLSFGVDAERWVQSVDLGLLSVAGGEDVILAAFLASIAVVVE